MTALKGLLPPPVPTTTVSYDHSNDPWFKQRFGSAGAPISAAVVKPQPVPPYLKRQGFVPRKVEEFGDGGAFPEIHVAQYPLGMGRDKLSKPGTNILPVTVNARGNVRYDAIVKQNENAKKLVYSQHKDLVPKILKNEDEEMDDANEKEEELQKEIEETTAETKAALEKIVNVRLSTAQPKNIAKQSTGSKIIKHMPSQKAAAFNSGAKARIIRMAEMPVDPLEPPKFKHKRVPRPSGSPPVPVMHSPPRPVTVKDLKDWKIPPCISTWKNQKGYTIPLDKRLAAEGKVLQELAGLFHDNLAKLNEALYVAEQKAREGIAMRKKVQEEMSTKEKEKKEQDLRILAQRARSERMGGAAPPAAVSMPSNRTAMDNDERGDYERPTSKKETDYPKETREEREGRLKREKIREERRRERERERRLEPKDAPMGKKSKITRDRDRDISEKVALGMASAGASRGGEVMYDQRLFNQEKGMESGLATDDQYNVYDKGLSTAPPTLSTLYMPKKDVDNEMYGGADEQLDKIKKTDRFKPDKGFGGAAERAGPRGRPVEFEKDAAEEADPFGLDRFLTEVKQSTKATEKVTGGAMRASAGSSMRDGYQGGSSRTRIGFERGCKAVSIS